MLKVLTAEEMREVDRLTTEKYGIPSILLMENAAHAAARVITEKLGGSVEGKSFLILCGKGNNGGDGAALARILTLQGANVFTNLFAKVEETKGDASINFKILRSQGSIDYQQWNWFEFEEFESFDEWKRMFTRYFKTNKVDCFVDACFGTGFSRPIKGIAGLIIEFFYNLKTNNEKSLIYISLDLPSGLNADSAEAKDTNFHADLTVTFTAPKPANVLPPASNFNGELVVAHIGSPQELIDNSPSKLFLAEKQDAQSWLERTRFTTDSYKNKRGHALLIVGSREYTGAAVLAGNAAMLSGVGLTTIATSESAQMAIVAKVLEEVITRRLPETENGAISVEAFAAVEKLIEKIDVVGIGCGLSSGEKTTRDFVREVVVKRKTPVVIDADALNALSPFDLQGSDDLPLILTPHEGEFLRLLGTKDKDAMKDRVKAVRDFAEKHQVILVLKGERVLIAAPDGTVVVNPTGNAGLGKAGNGDTLTGIITGFIAQAVPMKIDIYETVVAAVYLSGLAGDIAAKKFGMRSMLASDVRECLQTGFAAVEK
ncbi:MAG: NAD(P)H-hydrate dehydratase [Pyrinomonadaceae bacterium]|nr:NAD(P)H-hydrate dehydratase [Pyrinomonadaceae bacterium]